MKTFLPFLLCFLFFNYAGYSLTNTFNGPGTDWNTASNWSLGSVPTINDDVVIPSVQITNISADSFAKSVSVSGTLTISDGKRLTVGSAPIYGNFTVNAGGSFTMPGGSGLSTLIVYGNYINYGISNFWKSIVIITGDLYSPSTSGIQNQGNVIVGGNIIGDFNLTGGDGSGQIYAVNPNATVTITPVAVDNNVTPGVTVSNTDESQSLVDLMNSVLYGITCPFTISGPSNTTVCTTTANQIAILSTATTVGSPTYQWQVNVNIGFYIDAGWADLTNDATYSGVTSNTLTITNVTSGMNNYKYRVKITSVVCTKNGDFCTLFTSTLPPPAPTLISGTTPQCPSNSGQIYTAAAVSGAISYNWIVPTGWVINSGNGTTSIFVTTGPNYNETSDGNITVTATNGCGTSSATIYPVTVVKSTVDPGTVSILSGSSSYCSFTNSTTLTLMGSSGGSNVVRWESSNDNFVTTTQIANTTTTLTVTNLSLTTSYKAIVAKGTSCPEDSSIITIAIYAPPNVGTITHPTCTTTGSIVLNDLPSSGTWTLTRSPGAFTTSGTGNITTISGLSSGTYSFTVTISGCTTASSSNAVLDAIPTNIWDGSSWLSGTPNSTQNLIFNGNFSSTADVNGCSCQINSGNVVFNSGHTLSLVNDVKVNSGALIFEDDASLVQEYNLSNTGSITYKRKTTSLKPYDYTYWSSPVVSATLSQLATNSLFYKYDPIIGDWVWLANTTVMTPGVGYIARVSPNIVTGTILETNFNGVPNNGNISADIKKSTSAYNLIGNPYPSALDADLFITDAANSSIITGTLYYWTHTTPITSNNYTFADYATYNLTGGVGTGVGTLGVSRYIAAGQGFFVEAKSSLANGGTYAVTFKNSMRVANNNSNFFKTSTVVSDIERHRLWISLSNSQGMSSQMLVGYVQGATNDFDSLFDGRTMVSGNGISIYTMISEDHYTIQGKTLPFSDADVVPMGYSTGLNGQMKISLDQFDGLFLNQDIYLVDNYANVLHNMKSGDYEFITTEGSFNNRFELQFVNQTLGVRNEMMKDDGVKIYSDNGQLTIISLVAPISKVEVYDVLGKNLSEHSGLEANYYQSNLLNINPQIVIIKITLENNQTLIKKVLLH